MFMKKKHHYHYYYHHHHHHCCNHRRHYHQFHHHHHQSLSAPTGANPVWGPLGWRKHIIIFIIVIIIIIIITIVIVFLPPSAANCVQGPFGGKSATSLPWGWSHFNIKLTSSQEGDFLSKEKQQIMFVFSKTCSVFTLLLSFLTKQRWISYIHQVQMWESQPSYWGSL